MKSRPILFNGAMVRALLGGTKTQTRRAINARGLALLSAAAAAGECWPLGALDRPSDNDQRYFAEFCPYGQPGDRLWVRETWSPNGPRSEDGALYRTDFPEGPLSIKFKPSIHMPRWASRITLEITGVRVERLQQITRADCLAEGIRGEDCRFEPKATFADLWESINGPASWSANPWVWVVEFKRVEGGAA